MSALELNLLLLGKSNSIARYAPVLMAAQVAFFLLYTALWITASLEVTAFSADTWGRYALAVPAEMWAAFGLTGSSLMIIGHGS